MIARTEPEIRDKLFLLIDTYFGNDDCYRLDSDFVILCYHSLSSDQNMFYPSSCQMDLTLRHACQLLELS